MIHYRLGKIADLMLIYPSYAGEFPEDERKTIEQLEKLLAKGDYQLVIAENISPSDEIVRIGFAFVLKPKFYDFLWLDYLVIEKDFQSKGYGSQFFDYLLQCYSNIKGMYIEVEIPDGVDVNKTRRVSYYERLGAIKLPINYHLPIEKGSMAMSLYIKPVHHQVSNIDLDEVLMDIKITQRIIHGDYPHLENVWSNIFINSPQVPDMI